MEQEIILEGIHAMLEEIRDNMKKNLELETIKSKLNAIEKICNEFAGQKFVTEDILAQFLACTLQKIAEMNKKQEEKIEKLGGYVLGHHKYMKEQTYRANNGIDIILKRMDEILYTRKDRLNLFKEYIKHFRW